MAEKTDKPFDPINEVNQILVDYPDAMSVDLVSVEGNVRHGFVNQSKEAKKARKDISVLLNAYWQSGAYNYDEISRKLRVSSQDVAAILDAQFKQTMWSNE